MAKVPVVLAVGTTHPYAMTGLLLDLATARALGVRPLAVVAGVSAQDAERVLARAPVDPATIEAQFAAVASMPVGAICIGALLDAASVRAVARGVERFPTAPIVCDPVVAASGGDRLAGDDVLAALRDAIFPRCALLTPNLDEAGALLGVRPASVGAMREAIPALRALGPAAVLLKGGHLDGDACDVFGDAERVVELREPRLAQTLRGTGSLLAAAIAARLAAGATLLDAIAFARAFVRERIAAGVDAGGMRVAW